MSFFFFSYHVHEKTILLPLLFVILNLEHLRVYAFDFTIISCMTLYPLMVEDGLKFQYYLILLFYCYFGQRMLTFLQRIRYFKKIESKKSGLSGIDLIRNFNYFNVNQYIANLIKEFDSIYDNFLRFLFFFIGISIHLGFEFLKPPKHLPFLWSLFFAVLGFCYFGLVWVRSHLGMLFYFVGRGQKIKKEVNKLD
jgi:alpha-1,3-glucosyltransferase